MASSEVQPPARKHQGSPAHARTGRPPSASVLGTSDLLAEVLANAPDYVVVLDRNGVIEYANRVDPPLRREDVIGAGVWRYIGAPEESIREAITHALETGATIEREVSGEPVGERWLRVRMRAVSARGGTRVVVFVTDISDTRKAQLELERTQAQLDESRRIADHAQRFESLGRFAGGVAHDFNNLLTSIISFSRFVMDDLAPNDPRRSDLAEVLRAADSASRLTRQLLAFSRKRPVEPRRVDLCAAVSNLAQILRRVVGETIRVEIRPCSDPVFSMLDPGQLDQLLMNLAVNAKDAMPQGGQLTLAIRSEELRHHPALPPGRYAALSVADTGVGMSEETRRRAFEPFFTTKGEHGTGLGLATCYGIVKQAGGHIEVQSQIGRGSCFTLFLPACEAGGEVTEKATAQSAASEPVQPCGLARLALVVEDQPAILTTMSRSLKSQGFQVLEANSAEEALSLVDELQAKIDLLVTDVVLPGMNGVALAGNLRMRLPSLRVVMCSGYLGGDAHSMPPLPADALFLAKPFTGSQLTTKVSTLYT